MVKHWRLGQQNGFRYVSRDQTELMTFLRFSRNSCDEEVMSYDPHKMKDLKFSLWCDTNQSESYS